MQEFDAQGEFLTQWGSEGDRDGQFAGPTGIAVGENGVIYVADTHQDRIQKFGSPTPVAESSWGAIKVLFRDAAR